MINNTDSSWGVKRSGHNIRTEIIGMISNAKQYIVIGGYNFTFKTAGYTFFGELYKKAAKGVPILMIVPPNLSGNNRSHQDAINFCIANGIGLILNGNNHSKWILTENDLYYGSSNFSEKSWKDRVEVVTLHDLRSTVPWKTRTIIDFKNFVSEDIQKIRRRSTMTRRPGLIVYTRIVWNNIKFEMNRLNPSIEKVKLSLENYETVSLRLENLCSYWFESEYFDDYLEVKRLSKRILRKVNKLCFYAYTNIYNESLSHLDTKELNVDLSEKVIFTYNEIHSELIEVIDYCKSQLLEFEIQKEFNLKSKNRNAMNEIYNLLDRNSS